MLKRLLLDITPEELTRITKDPRCYTGKPRCAIPVIEQVLNIDLSGYPDHQIELIIMPRIRSALKPMFDIARRDSEPTAKRLKALAEIEATIKKLRANSTTPEEFRELDKGEEELEILRRLLA